MANPDALPQLRRQVPTLAIDEAAASLSSWITDASGITGAKPVAVLRPASLAELQRTVKSCTETGLRLLPVSSAGEHHRGDTRCEADTAILDMSRFNRVRRVDRRNRVALFEAGVDFPQLTREAHAKGLRPLLPLAPRPGKSALAAYLEREPTIYPRYQWDLSDPLLCTEVVWGTGELFRTGSAAGPGSIEEQWAAGDAQKNPMGPGQSDLMRVLQGSQGTLGIATWCSAKCEALPSQETLHVSSAETFDGLVRIAYGLLRRNHADILFIVDREALSALLARDRDAQEKLVRALPRWHLVFSVAAPRWFPEDKLAWVNREIDALHATHVVSRRDALSIAQRNALHARLTRPQDHASLPWWKMAQLPATRELFFLSTLDRSARFVALLDNLRAQKGRLANAPMVYIQPLIGGRNCHVEFIFPHTGTMASHAAVNESALSLAADVRERGGFFSRPYGPFTDLAFAGSSTAWLLDKTKSIFDPARILSPGHLEPKTQQPEAAA